MFNFKNIFLIGPMGSGKSTIGKLIKIDLQIPFYDSDNEIEQRCGFDIKFIFNVEGEECFRFREAQVIKFISNKKGVIIATGGGTITHHDNIILLRKGIVIFLSVSVELQFKRIHNNTNNRPLLQCKNPKKKLQELYLIREKIYSANAYIIVSTEFNLYTVVNNINNNLFIYKNEKLKLY
ncbi:Shikimate kinase [Candidatus Johnevansia muelleri]|uniref:Shikimate kinase n=1 Tax=Candidatus Johnevansia muelleri TaxID=1495769 RepID=A0A078KDP9_9GAMM|nr:Shikimate kinase [Candidatus Evansia muelleri]